VIGVSILVGGAAALAYVFLAQMNTDPPKPNFKEEKSAENALEKPTEKPSIAATVPPEPVKAAQPTAPERKPEPAVTESPKPAPQPKAETKPARSKPETKPETDDSGYKARVTWQSGLSLRSEPTSQSERVGGLDYNTKVRVIGTSSDGQWQRVQSADGRQGWIKSGNISRE
jgi:outer membrane biosynthesis protein TonB